MTNNEIPRRDALGRLAAGLVSLTGLASLLSGCSTLQPKAGKESLHWADEGGVQEVIGRLVDKQILRAQNNHFKIDDKVSLPSGDNDAALYLVIRDQAMKPYTEGYLLTGRPQKDLEKTADEIDIFNFVGLKFKYSKSLEYVRSKYLGREIQIYLYPLAKGEASILVAKPKN